MTAFARRPRALLPSSLACRFAPRRCSVASEAVCSARSATVCLCTPRYAKLYCDLSAIMRARYGWASTYSPAPPHKEFAGATEASPLTSLDAGPALCKAVAVAPNAQAPQPPLTSALRKGGASRATTAVPARPPPNLRRHAHSSRRIMIASPAPTRQKPQQAMQQHADGTNVEPHAAATHTHGGGLAGCKRAYATCV